MTKLSRLTDFGLFSKLKFFSHRETPGDVTRAVIADGLLSERRTVQKRLQRLGIEVLEAPANSFSSELLSRYLTLTRQERI